MFCNHCGNPIIGNEKYCTKCGSPVGNPYVQTASGNKQSKNKKAVMIGVISFLATMTVILIVLLVYFASADKTTITKITPETEVEVTETTTQIPLSESDTEFIENELYYIFPYGIDEYDYQINTTNYVFRHYFYDYLESMIYVDIFGKPAENEEGYGYKYIETYDALETPDPLNLFYNSSGYHIYDKENIDYILINLYNIPKDTVKNTPIEDYILQDDPHHVNMYYYNGYIYYEFPDGSDFYQEFYFQIVSIAPQSDGKYKLNINEYEGFRDASDAPTGFNGNYEMIVEPKILNGEKHLSIYSSRRVA